MRRSQLIITMLVLALLLGIAFSFRVRTNYGALPWFGWIVLAVLAIGIGVGLIVFDTRQRHNRVLARAMEVQSVAETPRDESAKAPPIAVDPAGPPYPHPVINAQTCIGCHACAEACPHDVLAIVNGIAVAVATDQCMEDTSCQVECPTNPKSCFVVNTSKAIPERKVPRRDNKFMTNIPGIYMIGDVSGVPLIKNAINEGGAVIDYVAEDLGQAEDGTVTDYDIAIIGIGPAGLSAAAIAKQRGVKYIAIEQAQVVAGIQQAFQAGKLVYFKPDGVKVIGGISLPEAPCPKEVMIKSWVETMRSHQLKINEFERCQGIKPDGDAFVVFTEQDKTKQTMQYRARRVVLAIGNRGAPMRLNVRGEELTINLTPTEPVFPVFCVTCGTKRVGQGLFCHDCGMKYVSKIPPPFKDDKVKYRLSDPNNYRGKHCVVVGAGNSAVEAAVDLAAYRSADGTKIVDWRDNNVTLVIRSGFKGDVKLGNKMMVYECIDEGKITAYFHSTVKEITETEVVLMEGSERDAQTAKEKARFKNDYVFALIGGDKPTKFLESIGIKIG